MKKDKHMTFVELRKRFHSMEELGNVINRTRMTVFTKMTETGFTPREQTLILQYLGMEDNEENKRFIFRR